MDEELRAELVRADLDMRDAAYVEKIIPAVGKLLKTYFRTEVRDTDRIPAEGPALIISNHSGGIMAMDVPILADAFVKEFGPERPIYCLAHDLLFNASSGAFFRRCGFLPANRESAAAALESGGVTILFPGGDYDVYRPTSKRNVIDFNGRTGYVRAALEADVPIVPAVSVGGQEAQLHLWRGEPIAKLLRLESIFRSKYFPITFGFPFGLGGAFPPNLPLPTKITTQVLDAIDLRAEFGEDPDIDEVDAEIRRRMQAAVDELAAERRFPVLG